MTTVTDKLFGVVVRAQIYKSKSPGLKLDEDKHTFLIFRNVSPRQGKKQTILKDVY